MSKAERRSKCPICGEQIEVGDEIVWSSRGFACASCKPRSKVKQVANASLHSPMAKATRAVVLALLTFVTGWLGVKTDSLVNGRDKRDEDLVRFEKALTEDRSVIESLRERVAFLEGRNAQRDLWTGRKPTPVSEIPVSRDEVREYQQKRE